VNEGSQVNEDRAHTPLVSLWNPVRACLNRHLHFGAIKDVVGLVGFDMAQLAHLTQQGTPYTTKDTLLSAIDAQYGALEQSHKNTFGLVLLVVPATKLVYVSLSPSRSNRQSPTSSSTVCCVACWRRLPGDGP
jgi:hypothetical protein